MNSGGKRNIEYTDETNDGGTTGSMDFSNLNLGLPPSLPSYVPSSLPLPPAIGMAYQPPFMNEATLNSLNAIAESELSGSSKRQAPVGQWKTPPQFLYTSRDPRAPPMPQNPGVPELTVPLSFQEIPYTRAPASSPISTVPEVTRTPNVPISSEQFKSSTGLALDTSIIAKMNGRTESELTIQHVQDIMSQPNMLSIYQKMQEEDERRRKRLARNRNSARMRRMKKKSLVESNESKVSRLEGTLNEIKDYQYGNGKADQLVDILGEPSQYPKMEQEDQRAFVCLLLEKCSASTTAISNSLVHTSLLTSVEEPDNSELKSFLNLEDHQIEKLKGMKTRLQSDARALAIVNKCLAALRTHNWLQFPKIEQMMRENGEILSSEQVNKLTEWSKMNQTVIEKLQISESNSEEQQPFIFNVKSKED